MYVYIYIYTYSVYKVDYRGAVAPKRSPHPNVQPTAILKLIFFIG